MKKSYIYIPFFALCAVIMLCGCSSSSTATKRPHVQKSTATQTTVSSKQLYVVKNIDEVIGNITFCDIDTGEDKIYSYGSDTSVLGKSGMAITIGQLAPGMMVDVYVKGDVDTLEKIQISPDEGVWENTYVTNFSVDESTHSMKIGQTLYAYGDETRVFSEGELISIEELTNMDRLVVRGYDKKVCSIVVDKGHGYIELSGTILFKGGYVDVDGILVKVIEDNMLLMVTEGSYKVKVSNGEYKAEKYVNVTRNLKSVVDFSDVSANVTITCNVNFNIDVADAVLYVDGKVTDPGAVQTYAIGTHTVRVEASGYETFEKKYDFQKTYEVVDIILNPEETTASVTETTTAVTDETTTAETEAETVVSTVNKVNVKGPEGASIYFDGAYMGTAPVTFDLVTGNHVISVLDDMSIKSYTVNLLEGGDDVTYDFTEK